ncbi:MAG: SMC-Scp complex subunit ScpB [Armatimonadota bacterium]|nr:SMC-Scp complex subunit ScpB [bacterium]
MEAQEPEVVEVVSIQPVAEVTVADVAQVATGVAVVRGTDEPRKGRGLAALFSRKPRKRRNEPEETQADIESAAALMESASVQDSTPAADIVEEESGEDASPHKNGKLASVIECMLFVASEPLGCKQLASALDLDENRIEDAIKALESDLGSRGLQLMRVAGGYQLCTKPEYADYCALILQPAKRKLSKAALETLAVVAYRQPCTMPEVEAVRGVAVDGVMKTLAERGLVKEAGRKQTPGRPILYATTPEFLEYFGLNDITELPDIDLLAVEEVKALEAQRDLFNKEASTDAD